ncbi:hypothetical protein EDD85DRAFT_940270 [Armillaria nabsnona]|nr:hypothetical protein EDD85DRAFT_940270 [Armillaria nabsnona]
MNASTNTFDTRSAHDEDWLFWEGIKWEGKEKLIYWHLYSGFQGRDGGRYYRGCTRCRLSLVAAQLRVDGVNIPHTVPSLRPSFLFRSRNPDGVWWGNHERTKREGVCTLREVSMGRMWHRDAGVHIHEDHETLPHWCIRALFCSHRVLDNIHRSTLFRPFPLQVYLVHRPLRLSSCHVYASCLLGVVRAVRKATIRTDLAKSGGAFGIITAFIAYYVGLSELLASWPKAVTIMCLNSSTIDTHGSGPDRTVPSNGEAALVWGNRRRVGKGAESRARKHFTVEIEGGKFFVYRTKSKLPMLVLLRFGILRRTCSWVHVLPNVLAHCVGDRDGVQPLRRIFREKDLKHGACGSMFLVSEMNKAEVKQEAE